MSQPRSSPRAATRLRVLLALGLALACWQVGAAESPTNEPARVKVSGFGPLGNREMGRLLRNFQLDGKMPVVIDRTFVEDAALVLLARAHDDGYLRANLEGEFTMTDGSRQNLAWTNALEIVLPRDFAARQARFRLQHGVRFYYRAIEFNGVTAFSQREATSYFVSGDTLLQLRGNRVFSPAALRSSLAALREAYARAGYQEAVVSTNQVTETESTGAVRVKVAVQEGRPTIVRSVMVRVTAGDQVTEAPRKVETRRTLLATVAAGTGPDPPSRTTRQRVPGCHRGIHRAATRNRCHQHPIGFVGKSNPGAVDPYGRCDGEGKSAHEDFGAAKPDQTQGGRAFEPRRSGTIAPTPGAPGRVRFGPPAL